MENVKLFIDDVHGIYVPQVFAKTVNRALMSGVSAEVLDYIACEESVNDVDFWDVWDDVLNNARVTVEGKIYHLYQCGDLYLIDWNSITKQEKQDFGLDYA